MALEIESAAPSRAEVPDVVRRRLAPPMPTDGRRSWLITGAIVVVAAALRLYALGHPPGKIFDEVYYATEGKDLLRHGVEWNHQNNTGDFVVHPPLGKWLIAFGEWISGRHHVGPLHWHFSDEFGWRIMPAIFGIIAVLLVTRLARRMFRSTLLGAAAGLLMTLDGLELVLSRTALLDVFLLTFVLASFYCLVMDRETRRRAWLRALEEGLDPRRPGRAGRPRLGVPWWRLGGFFLIGCAMAVKWSALWYILAFALLVLWWEVGTRRCAGVPRPWRDTLLDETIWVGMGAVIAVAVYLTSWTGWFASSKGYDRNWLRDNGHEQPFILGPLRNLWQYHSEALHFHDTLSTPHQYQSWPWQWLLLGRPVAFYYTGNGHCGASSCSSEVLLLGTPILWWSFLPALCLLAWFGVSRRDWRALAIGTGVLAGIVPWFPWEASHRTMFYFYVAPSEPFLILAVVYVLGAVMRGPVRAGPIRSVGGYLRRPPDERRTIGAIATGAYLTAIALCFAYFYPIYVARVITYAQWYARMWLGNRWI